MTQLTDGRDPGQSDKVELDVHHRPGNVHDSNGAQEFIRACVEHLRQALPGIQIEVRMDGAFFSDALVTLLGDLVSRPVNSFWFAECG